MKIARKKKKTFVKIPSKVASPPRKVTKIVDAEIVEPDDTSYRLQSQRADTLYPQVWYDFTINKEIVSFDDETKVRAALSVIRNASHVKMRYRVIHTLHQEG